MEGADRKEWLDFVLTDARPVSTFDVFSLAREASERRLVLEAVVVPLDRRGLRKSSELEEFD